ncbi:hypothetical protein [Vibrio anguillarum]|uniref:Uncharacterized protein n=1 Tax=Vibrio anguillarum TaxID=55601 RepID=A0AAW4BIY3_VIBAN|nr:hypothetical protein [Vibrio anguillarum]MBF4374409.1 hypothetical protein [Vibrio anguillarum]MBF4436977.1 hypothetical protein [Vibrio anguillarum]
MKYLLATVHRYPKFYKTDGTSIELELNYVDHKIISTIDENGQLMHHQIGGTPPCVGNLWLVDSIDESLLKLAAHGVYPFASKVAARENAKRLGLTTFKYIPVP